MASLHQAKEEVTMAVAQHHDSHTPGRVYRAVIFDILGHFWVFIAAWNTTAYIIPVYFLAHFLLALLASNLPWWELLQSPLLWLFPPGTGRLVAPSQGGRIETDTFRALSFGLRLALLFLSLRQPGQPPQQKIHEIFPNCTESHDCDGLPPWLRQPWWSQEATCPVTGDDYTHCLEEMPWYVSGLCNVQAGGCYFNALPDDSMVVPVLLLFVGPILALPMLLILSGGAQPLGQGQLIAGLAEIGSKGRVRRAEISQQTQEESASSEDESEDATVFARLKCFLKQNSQQLIFFVFTLCPFVLDLFLDLNGVLQFILTGNFIFAAVSAAIFAMSIAQQLRRGILHKFWQAAVDSIRQGHATDELEVMMLSEKSTEAAAQLMLQFYAFNFVTSSELAIWSFLFSMALSLKGVSEAVYYLIELDLYQVITKKEYEQLT